MTVLSGEKGTGEGIADGKEEEVGECQKGVLSMKSGGTDEGRLTGKRGMVIVDLYGSIAFVLAEV